MFAGILYGEANTGWKEPWITSYLARHTEVHGQVHARKVTGYVLHMYLGLAARVFWSLNHRDAGTKKGESRRKRGSMA